MRGNCDIRVWSALHRHDRTGSRNRQHGDVNTQSQHHCTVPVQYLVLLQQSCIKYNYSVRASDRWGTFLQCLCPVCCANVLCVIVAAVQQL